MKRIITVIAALLCAGVAHLNAADKIEAGPKGGRILGKTTPKAEFVVEKDKTISIHFYDAAGKPVPPARQTATVVAEASSGRETLQFENKEGALVSKGTLPAGDGYNVVVQLKPSVEARPQNFRFKLDLHECSGCKRAEYACTCHD